MNDETRLRAFDPALRAEIIDRLYDVALDPVRYEELVDVFEGGIGPLRLSAEGARLADPDMENHFKRASVFLDRFEISHRLSGYQAALGDVGRSAAFVSDGKQVVAANDQAGLSFSLKGGDSCAALPFAPEDRSALQSTIRRVAGGREEKAATLRIRDRRSGKPEILRIMPVKDGDGRPLALVTSSAVTWPEDFSVTLAEAFTLTDAEIEIVRGIVEGLGVRDIARERGRSEHTVRTQLRHVLSKTETHSQSDLLRVMLGLMDLTSTRGPAAQTAGGDGRLAPIVPNALRLADGRRLSWIEFGAPGGRPLLFLHMSYGLARWPADAEAQALQRNIRVIVPIRAGFGDSDPQPAVDDYCGRNTSDIGELIDRLGVPRLAILSLGADLRYGLALAGARPRQVTGILAAGGAFPATAPGDYARLGKWHRFIYSNARYAPRLLPFLVKAGFSLARRIGKDAFFRAVNAGSPGDMATFDDPLVREAMLLGSEIALSKTGDAHAAYTREIFDRERDWSSLIRDCPCPVLLMNGTEDPQAPPDTVREMLASFPDASVEWCENAGQLVFFARRMDVLDRLEKFLPEA